MGHGWQQGSGEELTFSAFGRSELAREKPTGATGHLVSRVIVHDHREQARSHRGSFTNTEFVFDADQTVGASLLAKNQQAPLGIWFPASSFTSIASRLAPTGDLLRTQNLCSTQIKLWERACSRRTNRRRRASGFPRYRSRPSRAGSLPQGIFYEHRICVRRRSNCGSEPAREKSTDAAGHLVSRVIVHDHREQARSHRGSFTNTEFVFDADQTVGASLLAKNQQTPLGIWFPASSFTTIASRLAPTGDLLRTQNLCSTQIKLWERACSRKINRRRRASGFPRHRSRPSRAGSLPQGIFYEHRICVRRRSNCGSEPAREKPTDAAG